MSKEFGRAITNLIKGYDLSYEEARHHAELIILNRVSPMSQGAFLAALTAKVPTVVEIRALWDVIMEFDTCIITPCVKGPLVENCGTGMDSVKTFNISTAAAIVACSLGVHIARHGSRGLTSRMGAIDILERVGIDVNADMATIKASIETAGIGVFNGASSKAHPQALPRILREISFGSVLNIAASLANPARPTHGVRGVYHQDLLLPTAEVMREIGFKRAIVVHGLKADKKPGLDEAGNIGRTVYACLDENGAIKTGSFEPEDLGLAKAGEQDITSCQAEDDGLTRFLRILRGQASQAETDIVALNAALILLVAGFVESLEEGITQARETMYSGQALAKLRQWIMAQNSNGAQNLNRLNEIIC